MRIPLRIDTHKRKNTYSKRRKALCNIKISRQYQDFERDGDFYHRYNQQKIQPPQFRRTPPQTFTFQDLLKMLGAVAGIFIPIVFVVGMFCGNGEVWIGATLAGIVAVGLVLVAAVVLIGLGIARLGALFFAPKRAS